MRTYTRQIPGLASVLGCLVLLLAAAPAADQRGRVSRNIDSDSKPSSLRALRDADTAANAKAVSPRQVTIAEGEELAADDGSPDGRGLAADGLTLAVRLTPVRYPVKLTTIRIYFVRFTNLPDPTGKLIRLLAFTGTGSRPPANPVYLVDRQVKIPQTGAYVDFAIPEAPEIREGDLYVGYQAPSPANGVGFGSDTEGVQTSRTFWSDDTGASWGGPLSYTDGTMANALIRAKISTTVPDSGEFELRTDDNSIEAGLLRDGAIYVNRLTPPKYPATLKKVRLYVPQMQDQPSPEGKSVNLLVFRDPSGSGTPPDNPKLDVSQSVRLGKPGAFTEFAIDGLTIASGDVYVGFEAPNPHSGIAFPVDMDGQPYQRMFRSRDGGKTYSGPVELVGETDQTIPANLMVRAVVSYGSSTAAVLDYSVVTGTTQVDIAEGGTESFSLGIKSSDTSKVYKLSAKFDPPAPGLSVELSQLQGRAADVVTAKITSTGPGDTISGMLTLEASDDKTAARAVVPVYLWREVASALIGPQGGTVQSPDVAVVIPKSALQEDRKIRLLTGKPGTGLEESVSGPIFRIDGLPDAYKGGMQIRMPVAAKSPSSSIVRKAAPDGSIGVLQFAMPNSSGQTVPVQVMQPTTTEGGTVVLNCPAGKATVTRNFSFWMLAGWLSINSANGNFIVFYPVTARDTAIYVADLLEKALTNMSSGDLDLKMLDRISYVSTLGTLGFTVHPMRVTLKPTLTANGITNAGQISLDLSVLKDEPGRSDNRATPGHELMHLAQDLYGANQGTVDWWAGKADPRVWADDAQATWFEPVAVSDPNLVPDNMEACIREFLLAGPLALPGFYAGDRDYGYGASSFVSYVHRFVDKTAIARWVAQRTPDREPWALLIPLIGGNSALANHWRDFGERIFTKRLLPNPAFPDPRTFMPLADDLTFRFMAPNENDEKKWAQSHDLSMRFYSMLLPNGIPTLTDNTVLGFKVLEKYPDVDLYVMGLKSGKFYSMLRGVGELTIDGKTVAGESGLLVAAVSYSYDQSPSIRSRRDITVRMGLADPTVKIQGYIGGDRVIGASYNFNTQNQNIPATATYTWDFGNGKPATTRAAQASWTQAGTYSVRVEARWANQTVRDELSITVAPDKPPAAKAEVLFDVYRKVKNSFGTSNQRCNNYTISIADPSGAVVDGGSSVARNGAYDTILPVANGYSYSIRYNYTTPCPDSGTRTGKFDVKANTVNGVMVETPPCEQ